MTETENADNAGSYSDVCAYYMFHDSEDCNAQTLKSVQISRIPV